MNGKGSKPRPFSISKSEYDKKFDNIFNTNKEKETTVMDDKFLYIVRGLPGSGKTTFAESLNIPNIYSADDFFTDENGNYNFDANKLKLAHKACKENTLNAMKEGANRIAVHNTFTRYWEMKDYFQMAASNGYKVIPLTVHNYHGNESIHNIPEETMDAMKSRFEFPEFI